MMIGFTYDPFCKQVIFKDGDSMPIDNFKQICYENNMADELRKIESTDKMMQQEFKAFFLPKLKKFIAENPQLLSQVQ